MLFVVSMLTICLWFGMGKCLCLPMLCLCYTSKLRFHHCPKTLQRILLNSQCILTVNHYILEFWVPERTLKFQEITHFRKLSNFNKNNFMYILSYAYEFIFKWNVCISLCEAVERERERERADCIFKNWMHWGNYWFTNTLCTFIQIKEMSKKRAIQNI